jgi:glutathione S-transferase
MSGRQAKPVTGLQLYYFSSCPYCLFVRLAMLWWGLKISLKDTLFEPGNSAELIAGGGKDQVPCLRIENEDGEVRWLYESIDIVRYFKANLVS